MTKYPLLIKNVGEDDYILMSKGHHDFNEFMAACKEAYSAWPMGRPEHKWVKAVPTRREGYLCIYSECEPRTRGSFPATYCYEAYGEEKWKYE